MPLVARVKIRGDVDHPSVAAALARLTLLAERLTGVAAGFDVIAHDRRDANGLFDLMKAHLRREGLGTPLSVHRHNCPHVAGFEEPTHGPCTDAAYAFVEEAV